MNKYRDQKIQKTSFLDKAFMKTLAGAVRFGTTLLVENVEKLDPVLNPIVSRDLIVVPSSFIMMYKVLIHCTHCSSLIVEQGDPAHRWPLISEVSQSQRFVNLSSFFIFLTLHSLLPFSELERRRGLQPQVQHYPHHQEPCGKVDSRYMLPRDIDKLHCHSSRITEPKPQQNLGM